MGLNITSERIKILKDDKLRYKVTLSTKVLEEGEEKKEFMRIFATFKKGIDLKNKTEIKIKDGFLSFFTIKSEEDGVEKIKRFPKVFISDFEVLQDGIDTLEPSEFKPKESKQENFTFNSNAGDDLPF